MHVLQVVNVLNHVWTLEACQAYGSASFDDVLLEQILTFHTPFYTYCTHPE